MTKMIQRLVKILDARGIHENAFESTAKLPRSRIWKWKKNEGEPTAQQALRMARALDVPLDWLIDEEGGLEPPASPTGLPRDEEDVLYAYRHLKGRIDPVSAIIALTQAAQQKKADPAGGWQEQPVGEEQAEILNPDAVERERRRMGASPKVKKDPRSA